MPDNSIQLTTSGRRAAAYSAAVLAIVVGLAVAASQFADTIASRAAYKEIAAFAVRIAPSNPRTHSAHARLLEKTFYPEDLPRSLEEYEAAVALSPHDFQLWLDLGRARSRSGDDPGAETALRKARELAPNYAQASWALGNFLLRQGKEDEAFGLIRLASDADPTLANPAIANAWQVYEGGAATVRKIAGDSPNLRAALAAFLAREGRFDDSVGVWSSLSESQRAVEFKAQGDEILREMLNAKRFRDAAGISGGRFQIGKADNGGFENPVSLQSPSVFEWKLPNGTSPQVAFDEAQKHSGSRSLVLVFAEDSGPSGAIVGQTVAVEPNRHYSVRGFYRSDLKAAATLRWDVVGADSKVIASTPSLEAKTDWTEFRISFTVPDGTDGVTLNLVRADCKTAICPISGRVWLDDIDLVLTQN